MIPSRHPVCALALALALASVPALALAEPGQMLHVTSSMKMHMDNMPMAIPPRVVDTTVCVARQHDVRDVVQRAHDPHHGDCTISDYKFSDSGGSFRYACTGRMPMTGTGAFTATAGGGSHVSIDMNSSGGEHPMAMTMTIDSTPTGATCDYTPPAVGK